MLNYLHRRVFFFTGVHLALRTGLLETPLKTLKDFLGVGHSFAVRTTGFVVKAEIRSLIIDTYW